MTDQLIPLLPNALRGVSWARYITAVVALTILFALIFQHSALPFVALVVFIQCLGLNEYHAMVRSRGIVPQSAQSYLQVALFSLVALYEGFPYLSLLLYASGFCLLLEKTWRTERLPHSLAEVAASLLGVWYMGFLPSFLVLLRTHLGTSVLGTCLILWLLAVTALGDTGAYIAGKRFGKHKMSPVISPNKTWEGLAGGLLASVLSGLVFRFILLPAMPLSHLVPLCLLLSTVGALGDLFESLLKRSSNIKDSGSFFPGHGGVLDRIDSLIMAAPVFYAYVYLASPW